MQFSQVVVLDVLQAGRERAGVGAVLERALVRVPVPGVDHECAEQEEDGDHERGEHDDLAAVASRAASRRLMSMPPTGGCSEPCS